MSNKTKIIAIAIIILISIAAYAMPRFRSTVVQTTLVQVSGGEYVPSAGYYEGSLVFQNVHTAQQYTVFYCAKEWSFTIGQRYAIDPPYIASHVSRSAELSGCYTQKL